MDEIDDDLPLREAVRKWRGAEEYDTAHRISAREAATILGIPKRTLDGIEQGRPFRYEELLRATLESPRTIRKQKQSVARKTAKKKARQLHAIAAE